jgi:hypothetical protein
MSEIDFTKGGGILPEEVEVRQIWPNLGGLGMLIVLLGFVYWQHTGAPTGGGCQIMAPN